MEQLKNIIKQVETEKKEFSNNWNNNKENQAIYNQLTDEQRKKFNEMIITALTLKAIKNN